MSKWICCAACSTQPWITWTKAQNQEDCNRDCHFLTTSVYLGDKRVEVCSEVKLISAVLTIYIADHDTERTSDDFLSVKVSLVCLWPTMIIANTNLENNPHTSTHFMLTIQWFV